MKIQEVKPTKTQEETLRDLRAGKAIRATDFCAAMGIKTFTIK